jgi:hypothetical protein
MMWVYIVLHVIPLFLNIFFVRNRFGTIVCIMMMLTIQLIKLFFEYMDLSQNEKGFVGYITDFSNIVDVTNFVVFLFWGACCIVFPESFIPNEDRAQTDMDLYDTDYFHY